MFADELESLDEVRHAATLSLGERVEAGLYGDARGEHFSVEHALRLGRTRHGVERFRRLRDV